MSTTLYEISNTLDIKSVRYGVVRILREQLADLIRVKKNETGWSYQTIADRSRGLLTHGTVFNIANGKVKEIKEASLQGLAYAFDMAFDEIARIAYGDENGDDQSFTQGRFVNLSSNYEKLDGDDKIVMTEYLMMFEREVIRRLRKGTKKVPALITETVSNKVTKESHTEEERTNRGSRK